MYSLARDRRRLIPLICKTRKYVFGDLRLTPDAIDLRDGCLTTGWPGEADHLNSLRNALSKAINLAKHEPRAVEF